MEIKAEDTITLLKDIVSLGKGAKLYGQKGERCKVISVMGTVLIVQGKRERFPVQIIFVQL